MKLPPLDLRAQIDLINSLPDPQRDTAIRFFVLAHFYPEKGRKEIRSEIFNPTEDHFDALLTIKDMRWEGSSAPFHPSPEIIERIGTYRAHHRAHDLKRERSKRYQETDSP